MKRIHAIAFTLAALVATNAAFATEYTIDPDHSTVGFTVKHLAISKVNGHFDKFSGEINFDTGKLDKGSVKVKIDPSSINTANSKRDDHLKSPDFFDVKKFSDMGFESTKISDVSGDHFKMTGKLTMHGVTKEITLDCELGGTATDPWGNHRVSFSAKGKLSRGDYGLKWNKALEAGGVVVGDEISIDLEVEAIQKAAGAGEKK
jgi:polyisoprenoid-binding protein YceI